MERRQVAHRGSAGPKSKKRLFYWQDGLHFSCRKWLDEEATITLRLPPRSHHSDDLQKERSGRESRFPSPILNKYIYIYVFDSKSYERKSEAEEIQKGQSPFFRTRRTAQLANGPTHQSSFMDRARLGLGFSMGMFYDPYVSWLAPYLIIPHVTIHLLTLKTSGTMNEHSF